jgi:hypothetical protein
MNKIPVGQTIRFAYAFTLGEIGTIIGLIWIPTLVNAVATFFVLRSYYGALIDSFENSIPPNGSGLGWPLLLAFLTILLLAMIAVAVTQQAMGLRQGPAFARVSLGSAEWRTFGGFFGLYMLFVLSIAVFAILVGAARNATGSAAGWRRIPDGTGRHLYRRLSGGQAQLSARSFGHRWRRIRSVAKLAAHQGQCLADSSRGFCHAGADFRDPGHCATHPTWAGILRS